MMASARGQRSVPFLHRTYGMEKGNGEIYVSDDDRYKEAPVVSVRLIDKMSWTQEHPVATDAYATLP